MNILIFVNHLLGIGHLKRMSLLARGLQPFHNVTLINGGKNIPAVLKDLDVVQLPSLSSKNESFTELVTDEGCVPDQGYLTKRYQLIQETVTRTQPHLMMTEHFPFGRGKLKKDFTAFLAAGLALPKKPLFGASVRDLLVSSAKKPEFQDLPYDFILVHGDERVASEWSFIKGPQLFLTGYFHEQAHSTDKFKDKILVVAGGRSVTPSFINKVHALAQKSDAQFIIRSETPQNPLPNCEYRPFIPDLAQGLSLAKLLISQAGYNLFVESQLSKVPTIFVPFQNNTEDEQIRRLQLMKAESWSEIISMDELSSTVVNHALTRKKRYPDLNVQGLHNSIRIINEHLERY